MLTKLLEKESLSLKNFQMYMKDREEKKPKTEQNKPKIIHWVLDYPSNPKKHPRSKTVKVASQWIVKLEKEKISLRFLPPHH